MKNPDIICIVESWLDPSILDNEISIVNYSLVRLDRSRHGGGVLLYIKDNLPFSIIISGFESLEFICIKIHDCPYSSDLCLGVLYNPPDNVGHVLSSLFSVLQNLPPTLFSNFILLGDFNINFLEVSTTAFCQLNDLLLSFNLTQVVNEPTRIVSSNKATLLDLALVSNLNFLEKCTVIPPLANSDHNGISLIVNQRKSPKPSIKRTIWKYSQADFVKASELIEETDWDQLFSGKSIDEVCLIWQETFLSIMDQCIPKGVLPTWASHSIRRIILKRNRAYKCYKRTGDATSGQRYQQLRNKAVSELRKAKQQYINNLSKAPNTKQFWSAVKSLNGSCASRVPTHATLAWGQLQMINRK